MLRRNFINGRIIIGKDLLSDYKKFERIVKAYKNDSQVLNTSMESFLAPTTLLPLLCFVRNRNINKIITHPNTKEYITRILNGEEKETNTPLTMFKIGFV